MSPILAGEPLLLHVGYPKTGTTFLQRRVFPATDANLVLAPRIDAVGEDFEPRRFADSLREQGEDRGGPVTILSQEALIGRFGWGEDWNMLRIADRLAETFPGARVLVVIRHQPDYLVSNYLYNVVQKGAWRRFPAYLAAHEESLRGRLRYDRLLERYRDRFGPEAVLVLPYEMLLADGAAFVDRILDFAGARLVAGDLDFSRVNPGRRSRLLLAVHRALNAGAYAPVRALRDRGLISNRTYRRVTQAWFAVKWRGLGRIVEKLFDRGGDVSELARAIPRSWMEEFRATNRRLVEMLDLPLARYGYPG